MLEKKPSECISADKTVHCNSSNCKRPAGGHKEQTHLSLHSKRENVNAFFTCLQLPFKQGLMFATKEGWDAYSPRWQRSKGLKFSTAHRSSLDFLTPCTWNRSSLNGWAGWQLATGLSTLHGLQHLPPIRKMSWDLHRKLTKRQEKQLRLTAHLSEPPSPSYSLPLLLVVDQTNATHPALNSKGKKFQTEEKYLKFA